MSLRVHQYPKCSTCRKALKWLDERGIEYESVDIVESPPSKGALQALWQKSGLPLKRFFNTSGVSYREGSFGKRLPTMSDEEALAARAADGKLIKRPLLESGERVLVGFKELEYAEVFESSAGRG